MLAQQEYVYLAVELCGNSGGNLQAFRYLRIYKCVMTKICEKCGKEVTVPITCDCHYISREKQMIYPCASYIKRPLNFFRTFINECSPYCFIFKFYLNAGEGIIDIIEERINYIEEFSNGVIIKSSLSYVQYVSLLFNAQHKISKGFIDERIELSSYQGRVDMLMHLSDQICDFDKKINILGENAGVRDSFKEHTQSLYDYINEKLIYYGSKPTTSIGPPVNETTEETITRLLEPISRYFDTPEHFKATVKGISDYKNGDDASYNRKGFNTNVDFFFGGFEILVTEKIIARKDLSKVLPRFFNQKRFPTEPYSPATIVKIMKRNKKK